MSNYNEVRQSIEDGDLIAVRGSHLIDRLTRLVTRSPVTHTGVAVWLDGRLFMADLNSGRNHLTALSCVPDFDVHTPPAGIDRPSIRQSLLDWLASPIDYGFAAFAMIGLRSMLKSRAFIHWRKIMVCSGSTVMIYEGAAHRVQDAGGSPPAAWLEHNRMLTPGELAEELPLRLSVRKDGSA